MGRYVRINMQENCLELQKIGMQNLSKEEYYKCHTSMKF